MRRVDGFVILVIDVYCFAVDLLSLLLIYLLLSLPSFLPPMGKNHRHLCVNAAFYAVLYAGLEAFPSNSGVGRQPCLTPRPASRNAGNSTSSAWCTTVLLNDGLFTRTPLPPTKECGLKVAAAITI